MEVWADSVRQIEGVMLVGVMIGQAILVVWTIFDRIGKDK